MLKSQQRGCTWHRTEGCIHGHGCHWAQENRLVKPCGFMAYMMKHRLDKTTPTADSSLAMDDVNDRGCGIWLKLIATGLLDVPPFADHPSSIPPPTLSRFCVRTLLWKHHELETEPIAFHERLNAGSAHNNRPPRECYGSNSQPTPSIAATGNEMAVTRQDEAVFARLVAQHHSALVA